MTRITDGVIETLAQSEAELLERVMILKSDSRVYREMAQEALALLAANRVEIGRQQARILALVAELKEVRREAQQALAQLRAYQEHAA